MANRWGDWGLEEEEEDEEGWMSIDEDDDSEFDKGSVLASLSLRDASVGRKAGQESSGGKAEVGKSNNDWFKQPPEALVQVKAPERVTGLKTAGTAEGERKVLEKSKGVEVPVKPSTQKDFEPENWREKKKEVTGRPMCLEFEFLAKRKAGQESSGGKAEVLKSNNDWLKQETPIKAAPPKGTAGSTSEKKEVHVKAPEPVAGLKTGGAAGGERKVQEKPKAAKTSSSANEPVRPATAEGQQKGLDKKKVAGDPDTTGARSLETSMNDSSDSFSSVKTNASAKSKPPSYKLRMSNDPVAQDGIPISAGLPPMDLFYANHVDISRKVINQVRKESGQQLQPGKLYPDRPVNQQKLKDLWDEMKREWDHMMFMFEHNLVPENQDQVYLWNSFVHSWGWFFLECKINDA